MGRKKKPHYRVVVADSRSPRDGRFVETLGYYKPLTEPARLVLDLERVDFWLGEGASPSGTVKTLISKARSGGDDTIAIGEQDNEEVKAKRAEELAARRAAEAKAAAEAAEAEKKAEEEAKAKAAAEAEAAAEGAEGEGDEAEEDSGATAEAGADAEAAASDDEEKSE